MNLRIPYAVIYIRLHGSKTQFEYDANGATVMEYSYDPWGNIEYHLSETFGTEEDAMLFTALCPLTYRGYNYDFTTGLYYLQSRYYNPEWGRFINCDDTNILLATKGKALGSNLFAYCNNNPVNQIDPTGFKSKEYSNGELLLLALVACDTITLISEMGKTSYLDCDIVDFNYIIEQHGLIISKIAFKTEEKGLLKYQVMEVVYGTFDSWSSYTVNEKPEYTPESKYAIRVAGNEFGEAEQQLWRDANVAGDKNEFLLRLTSVGLTSITHGYKLFNSYYHAEKWCPYSTLMNNGINKYNGMGFLYNPTYTSKIRLKSVMKLNAKKEKVPAFEAHINYMYF